MFGEDISLLDLIALLKGIREKNLTLEIKITNGQWKKLSKEGTITSSNDIRLRLFA